MERFIVIHGVNPDVNQDEVWEGFHRVATSAVRGAKWLSSYFLPETEEMLCDWEAPDEAAVRESLEASGALDKAPIKKVYMAIHADPEFFK
jgi:hypothetical protein